MSEVVAAAIVSSAASLLGAILVGVLAFWGATRAARQSLQGLVDADRVRLREESQHQRATLLRSLQVELAWNARIIQEERTKVGWAWVALPAEALNMSQAYWSSLPSDARHIVEEAARCLARYNALASYANSTVAPGSDAMDSSLKAEAQAARRAMEAAADHVARLVAVTDAARKQKERSPGQIASRPAGASGRSTRAAATRPVSVVPNH
jgi:hypothetical protein